MGFLTKYGYALCGIVIAALVGLLIERQFIITTAEAERDVAKEKVNTITEENKKNKSERDEAVGKNKTLALSLDNQRQAIKAFEEADAKREAARKVEEKKADVIAMPHDQRAVKVDAVKLVTDKCQSVLNIIAEARKQ